MLGKIAVDWLGRKISGKPKDEVVKIRAEVDQKEVEALQAKIAKLDGDEVRIRAAVDKSSLRDIDGLADYAVQRAKDGKNISFEGVSQLNTANIANQAHGFIGVRRAITAYNESLGGSKEGTDKLVESIKKSNSSLGKHLEKFKQADGTYVATKSKMAGYALSLAGATLKTIGLNIATTALNATVSFGASLIVNGLITAIDSWIHSEEKALEKSRELAEAQHERFEKAKSEHEELKSLIDEYRDISMSENWDNSARERAREIQQEINELIGDEALMIDGKLVKLDDEIEKRKEILELLAKEEHKKLEDAAREARNTESRNFDVIYDAFTEGKAVAGFGYSVDSYKFGTNGQGTVRTFEDDDGQEFYYDPSKVGGKQKEIFEKYSEYFIGDPEGTDSRLYFHIRDLDGSGFAERWKEYDDAYNALINMRDDLANAKIDDTWSFKRIQSIINTYSENYDTWKNSKNNSMDYEEKLNFNNALKGVNNGSLNILSYEDYKKIYESSEMSSYRNELGYQYAEYASKYERDKNVAEGNFDQFKDIDFLKEVTEALSPLGNALKEFSEDGNITIDTISKLKEVTGLSGEEWEKYKNALMGMESEIGSSETALDNLIYKTLENKYGVEGLANANAEHIAVMLSEIGVSNETTKALEYKKRASANAKIATMNLKGVTEAEIKDFVAEANSIGLTTGQMYKLIASEVVFNNSSLSINDKIRSLNAITVAALGAGAAIDGVFDINTAKDTREWAKSHGIGVIEGQGDWIDAETGQKFYMWAYEVDGIKYDTREEAALASGYSNLMSGLSDFSFETPQFSSNDNSDESYFSIIDALIEDGKEKIEEYKDARDTLTESFENAIDVKNKEEVEMLRGKLSENIAMEKAVLLEQNALYTQEMDSLLQALYSNVPEFQGRTWDEISNVEIARIEDALGKADNKTQLNFFKGIVDDLKALDDVIEDNIDSIDKLKEENGKTWESLIKFQKDYSDSWIDNQKAFDLMSEKEELAAYGRIINNNKEFQKQILADETLSEKKRLLLIRQTRDEIEDAQKQIYDLRKTLFDDATNFGSSYYDSRKTLLQSYYDVTNSIADAQHEINKELEASKTMYEYLDESTRKLLFNQEDYNALSEELYDIQYQADKLQRQYQRELETATLDTIEEITSNYQMQYETMMKQYEIAKAELEVAKKRQKLDNVLNERNVRMFVNGQWQWVANTQDVIDAQNELADAEYEAQQARLQKEQTDSMNSLTAQQDKLNTIINEFGSGVIDLDDAVSKVRDMFNDLPSMMHEAFSDIGNYNGNKANSSSGGASSDGGHYVSATLPGGMGSTYVHVNSAGKTTTSVPKGTVIHAAGGDFEITGGSAGNYTSKPVIKNKLANGTGYTKPGDTLIGEKEPEIYIDSNGHLIPVVQPTIFKDIEVGGKVFNGIQMRNLESLWDLSNVGFNHSLPAMVERNQSVSNIDNSIHINGMTISEQGNEDWIKGLKRHIATHR